MAASALLETEMVTLAVAMEAVVTERWEAASA
jgi:hypothetical protein